MVETINDFLNEAVRENQFKLGATLPISWKYQALVLKNASDKVFMDFFDAHEEFNEKFDSDSETFIDVMDNALVHVYLLLIGFAIENLIKGLLLFRHPEYLENNNKLSKKIRDGHNLYALFLRAEWAFESRDEHWLRCLSIYITWRGRYPIPINLIHMLPKKENGRWMESFLSDDPRRDYMELNSLFERVMKKLSEESDTLNHQLPAISF